MGKKKSAVVIEIGSNGESQTITKNGNGEHAKNGNGHDAVENEKKPQKVESKKNGNTTNETSPSPKPTTNGVPKPEKTEKKEKKEVNENTEKVEKVEKKEKKENTEKKEKVEKKENTPKTNGAAEKKEKTVEKKEKTSEKVEKSPKPETTKLVNLSSKKDKLVDVDMSITATGQLLSNPLSYDVKINNFSLAFHGVNLIVDTVLELNSGRRYGLIGRNGSGKSTFLKCLARREVPIPPFVDIFLLDKEQAPSEKSALEIVMSTEEEVARLEKEVEDLLHEGGDSADSERLNQLYERLDELDADKAESRAAQILNGLGFTKEMQRKPAKEFSGGWRMRIALARALFVSPALLLLDEPTNHLDLESCVWLEDYLATYKRCLIVISHSQDFLNGVCTNIMLLNNKRQLTYYGGNYDTYVKTRSEVEENQMKQWKREQDEIAHMKEYIARFGHGSAKLAKQAQSKEKTLAKMEAKGLTEKVEQEKVLNFRFTDCGKLNPPVLTFLDVGFAYSGLKKDMLYTKLEFGVDCDSRIALVGRNGCGKSTLLKLMVGELIPTEGSVRCNPHLRIARYHQHLADQLDMEATPIEYMRSQFPGFSVEEMRSKVGRFGITGDAQMAPIKNLSDGQRSRVVFSWLAEKRPHLLLLDEPTNHLDMETIDSLAAALKVFEGGMVLVSHDFRLINQVAEEIWICGNKTITKYYGDIVSYKDRLRKENADFK